MKKILTTTVITAILATSGFAATEPVEEWVYNIATFTTGTDNNPTTIMPSGTVTVGSSEATPTIASTWTLKEGSVMNVTGGGFTLTGTIKINPNDAEAIPVQRAIGEQLYYEYEDANTAKVYQLVDSEDKSSYVELDGSTPVTHGKLIQVMTSGITGVPQLTNDGNSGTLIRRTYNTETQKIEGKISGGTVTYAPKGAIILSKDSKTDFADDSSLKEKTKYTMAAAGSAGFQETYLSCFPWLGCYCEGWNFLNLRDTSNYSEKLKDSNTLQEYLNSFGFYPDPVTVLDGNGIGFNLLTLKGDDAAIQIPKYIGFSTAASGTKYEVKTNLHNVGVDAFTEALTFASTTAEDGATPDTLVFSGDNSNLNPQAGITYANVNVTVCDANSWIAAPKGQTVTFQGGSNPTSKMDADMKISHRLEVKSGSKFEITKGKTVKFFGTVILGG